tara:strand:- start:131 stop:523 length:393 start_codon:yes stop_codon:yes gene_type:complete
MVEDPTTTGQITARLGHLYTQTIAAFPDTNWACHSPRPGTVSEHPLGRACDLTFGNTIGEAATGPALDLGWDVTNWMKDHAQTLGVAYLIWQNQIWSTARADEGWRPYERGTDVTTRHDDHLHVTVRAGI